MNIADKLLRIFFPKKCSVCHEIIPIQLNSCNCTEKFTSRLMPVDFCEHCSYGKNSCTCNMASSIYLPHVTSVYLYSDFIRQKIFDFKFNGKKELSGYFSGAIIKRLSVAYPNIKFDCITFVPMSYEATKERGYNQSELLAKAVGKALKIPKEKCLLKIRDTKKQHDLSAKERTENIKNSIIVNNLAEIKGKTILLCDDVKTTGATLFECTNALLNSGAKDVFCVCIASADIKAQQDIAIDKESKNK